MAGLLNLDSLGTGIRSLLDNPAFGGGGQGQQGGNPAALPFGDFAGQPAATSLWGGGQQGLGQPATSLWGGQQGVGQASTSLWGGDLAGTTSPLAPVYGQAGTGYDQLGRVFSSGVGLQNTLDQIKADAAARAAAKAKEPGGTPESVGSSLGTPGGDFGSPSADVLNGELNGTALAGQGQTILDASARHGIPASALMAIFKQESSYRTPSGANNYGGLRPADGSGGFASYADLPTGIDAVAANLGSDLYRGKSLADVIGIWAPSSDGNDPNAYTNNALATIRRLGGNATAQSIVSGASQPLNQSTAPGRPGAISTNAGGSDVTATAQQLLGTPYQLGGLRTHPDTPQQGLDCSEFTAWAYKQHGVTLPWNAQQQFNATTRVDANSLQPGDLVFFSGTDPTDPDPITHVGIYQGNGQMINAQDGGVKVADLNSQYWQSHYAGAGRVSR